MNDSRARGIAELQQRGWLKQIEWYDRIDSTNSHARQLLADGELQCPSLLLADEQTSGRGRSERRWWSPRGCLMMTLVIDSDTFVRRSGEECPLALLVGVGLADAVSESLGSQICQLKWPNDLYAGNKKLAGILIESFRSVSQAEKSTWLIGIGLNVNVDWEAAPPEVRGRATCMARLAGHPLRIDQVLIDVIEHLQLWLSGWQQGHKHWLSGWSERCLLTGKWVRVRQGHAALKPAETCDVEGWCEGVDVQGRLLVRQSEQMAALSVGEVVAWGEM
jgi:BirA family transcriptional regulator, biotin operon repressor / biotin---[acetyl-CoA-carboxylase] ligase